MNDTLPLRSSHIRGAAGLLLAAMIAPAQEAPPATFHAGTRLVEVEVVVRAQPVRPPGVGAYFADLLDSGPPFGPPGGPLKGLTKDDFSLLDDGKLQQIAVFRAGASKDAGPVTLPPGAVSNRQDSRGQPLDSATAVLIDLLNTQFDTTEYARLGLIKLLRSLSQTDSRVAVYTLGQNLHVLHDFTDDPQKLADLAAKLEQPHGAHVAGLDSALGDFGDLLTLDGDDAAAVASQVHAQKTVKAVQLIAQHLSGVPGRKNLIWMFDEPGNAPPPLVTGLATTLARQSNIVVYPVILRAVACFSCPPHELDREHYTRELAAATGGRAFFDAMDLPSAVRAAEEDTSTNYVLGYYPAEETLDGKYHTITVKLHDKAPDRQPLEVHYRPGFLATKIIVPTPSPTPQELFEGPVNSARIGLIAQATPAAQSAGSFDVRVTVDLRDIHLERRDGHFIGAFDLSVPNPAAKGTVKTGTVTIDLTGEQLSEALENGLAAIVSGVEPEAGEIRVVVRDRSTGIAGSLRIPVTKP
jgi:VWFA-related protein